MSWPNYAHHLSNFGRRIRIAGHRNLVWHGAHQDNSFDKAVGLHHHRPLPPTGAEAPHPHRAQRRLQDAYMHRGAAVMRTRHRDNPTKNSVCYAPSCGIKRRGQS